MFANIIDFMRILFLFLVLLSGYKVISQALPDQQNTLSREELISSIEESNNLVLDNIDHSIELVPGQTSGYFITKPMEFEYSFNHGLPSWNGTAPNSASSFKVQMRFEMDYGWSSWVTVGFWDKNIWPSYGSTDFTSGKISIDEVKLYQYIILKSHKEPT